MGGKGQTDKTGEGKVRQTDRRRKGHTDRQPQEGSERQTDRRGKGSDSETGVGGSDRRRKGQTDKQAREEQ